MQRFNLQTILLASIVAFTFYTGFGQVQQQGCHVDTSQRFKANTHEVEAYFRTQNNDRLRMQAINYVPVSIHITIDKFGNQIREEEVYRAFVELNRLFLPMNVQFYFCKDIDYLKDDKGYGDDTLSFDNDPNTIDVVYAGVLSIKGACGYATLGPMFDGVIVIQNSCSDAEVLLHEMGHYFNLWHTHDYEVNGKEFVNRSNCATAGDELCDTQADPNVYLLVDDGCIYTGTAKDPNGETYTPPLDNIMSYSMWSCTDKFTPQQYQRMRYYYEKVAMSRLQCTIKPDLIPLGDSLPDRLVIGKVNTFGLVVENFSSVGFNKPFEYKVELFDQTNVLQIVKTYPYNRNWTAFDVDTLKIALDLTGTLKQGIYKLRITLDHNNVIDETVSNNNVYTKYVGVFPEGNILADIQLTASGASTNYIGNPYRIDVTLKNIGGTTTEPFSFEYFISKDKYITADDIRSVPIYNNLDVGAETKIFKGISIPFDTSNRPYYIILVADFLDYVEENNENNNKFILTVNNVNPPDFIVKPDFVMDSMSLVYSELGGMQVLQGDGLTMSLHSRNIGAQNVPDNIFAAIYLSKDAVYSSDDFLSSESANPIFFAYGSVSIPADFPPGEYYVLAKIDSKNLIIESDENNNFCKKPLKVKVLANSNIADLTIVPPVQMDTILEIGKKYKFEANIKNVGSTKTADFHYYTFLVKDRSIYEFPILHSIESKRYMHQYTAINTGDTYRFQDEAIVDAKTYQTGIYYFATCIAEPNSMTNTPDNNCYVYGKPILIREPLTETDDVAYHTGIVLYPNPTNSGMVQAVSAEEITNTALICSDGSMLPLAIDATGKIDLGMYDNGLYFLKLTTASRSEVHKVVVNR